MPTSTGVQLTGGVSQNDSNILSGLGGILGGILDGLSGGGGELPGGVIQLPGGTSEGGSAQAQTLQMTFKDPRRLTPIQQAQLPPDDPFWRPIFAYDPNMQAQMYAGPTTSDAMPDYYVPGQGMPVPNPQGQIMQAQSPAPQGGLMQPMYAQPQSQPEQMRGYMPPQQYMPPPQPMQPSYTQQLGASYADMASGRTPMYAAPPPQYRSPYSGRPPGFWGKLGNVAASMADGMSMAQGRPPRLREAAQNRYQNDLRGWNYGNDQLQGWQRQQQGALITLSQAEMAAANRLATQSARMQEKAPTPAENRQFMKDAAMQAGSAAPGSRERGNIVNWYIAQRPDLETLLEPLKTMALPRPETLQGVIEGIARKGSVGARVSEETEQDQIAISHEKRKRLEMENEILSSTKDAQIALKRGAVVAQQLRNTLMALEAQVKPEKDRLAVEKDKAQLKAAAEREEDKLAKSAQGMLGNYFRMEGLINGALTSEEKERLRESRDQIFGSPEESKRAALIAAMKQIEAEARKQGKQVSPQDLSAAASDRVAKNGFLPLAVQDAVAYLRENNPGKLRLVFDGLGQGVEKKAQPARPLPIKPAGYVVPPPPDFAPSIMNGDYRRL